jgi:DNA-binding transcriptional regulator YiaG
MVEVFQEIQFHRRQSKVLAKTARLAVIRYRELLGLSQKDFAAKLDISPQYLCDVEIGRREISDTLLSKLLKVIKKNFS